MTDIFTPEYFEKHITTVVPIVNVDLLIRDKKGRILLSWRNDSMFQGWHVPGRIVRFKQTLLTEVNNCYWKEIDIMPENDFMNTITFLEYFETIREQDHRGHFITFLFGIKLIIKLENPDYFKSKGFEWFTKCPENLIPEQEKYRKYFK